MKKSRRTILAMRFLAFLLIFDVANDLYFKITVTSESVMALTMLLIFKMLLAITITIILYPLIDLYIHSIKKMESEKSALEKIKQLIKERINTPNSPEDEILP